MLIDFRETESSTIIVAHFNTPISEIVHLDRKPMKRSRVKLHLRSIDSNSHSKEFLSNRSRTHILFIQHMDYSPVYKVGQKTSLNRFASITII